MAPRKLVLPKPLPEGFILTDTDKRKWRLGRIIEQGGFGLIYLASQDTDRPVAADAEHVIKVEYQENGPLFTELKFYQRAAKAESMQQWKRSRQLDFLGIPTYKGSGLAEHNNLRYRFMAMDRLGSDLQKICDQNRGRLKKATVLQLGQGLVSVLEYIHEHEYVHADIKAANLMLGYKDPEQVYLADYGLAYRYCPDGLHKEYKENPKKGHNGTIEYTSLDAHKGLAPSRRGDLQILGFCLLHWLCGSLPWDDVLKNPTQVQEAKARLMHNLPDSVQELSDGRASTEEVAALLLYVKTLDYQDKPDYKHVKTLLGSEVRGRLDFSMPKGSAGESGTKEPEPPTKGKQKDARAKGASKAKAAATGRDEGQEEGKKKPKAVPACYIRGPPITKPQPQQKEDEASPAASRSRRPKQGPPVTHEEGYSEEKEEEEMEVEEEKEARPRPVPERYMRGPPITPRDEPKQKEDEALPAASTSLRPKRGPRVNYKEHSSEDEEVKVEKEEEEEEEEGEREARPRPIPACYTRGPPITPREQPKQKINHKYWITEDHSVSLGRLERHQEGRLEPPRSKHSLTCSDVKDQSHPVSWDRSEERLLHHRASYTQRQWDNWQRDNRGDWEWSDHRGPKKEAGPTQQRGLLSWFVNVSVLLLLGAVLGVCLSAFQPF